MWASLDRDEQARVLALVLDEVLVDGATGEAELRFRGAGTEKQNPEAPLRRLATGATA